MRFFWTPAGALEGVNFYRKSNFLITQIFFAENPWGPKNPPPTQKSIDLTLETPSTPVYVWFLAKMGRMNSSGSQ